MITNNIRKFWILSLLIGLIIGVVMPLQLAAQDDSSVLTADLDSSIAREWMHTLYELVRENKINAPAASRVYAYTSISLYEAVVFGMPDNFSLGGSIQGLPLLPYIEEGEVYDYPSIANASIATMMTGLFEEANAGEETFTRISDMHQQQHELRLEEIDEDIVERSEKLGEDIANALLDWVATDNYGPTRKLEFELPSGDDSFWVATTEGQLALEPFWGQLRPFGMGYGEQCNEPFRLEFSTDPDSTFYKQAQEVLNTSDNLTEEQQDIARFWVDTPGITGAPSGHWMMIATQFSEQYELNLARTAEMYVLTSTALADSFISAWNQKYQVNLVRPVTYINKFIRRNWAPYIQSPPFPEYPSGHSVASSAAAEVLTIMFGVSAFVDRTPIINGHENLQREFTSFEQAASEAAISRMYGGIHYRAAIELGLRQGRCVGQSVLNGVRLRSIPQGEGPSF